MGDLETVKVRNPNDPECGYMIINKSDFREGEHELHEDHACETGGETLAQRQFREEDEARRRYEASRGQAGGSTSTGFDRNPSGTFSEPTPTDIRYPNKDATEFESNHGALSLKSAAGIREELGLEDKPGGIRPEVHEAVQQTEAVRLAGQNAASEAESDSDTGTGLHIGKGPGGRFFVKDGRERVSDGFATEDQALAELTARQAT